MSFVGNDGSVDMVVARYIHHGSHSQRSLSLVSLIWSGMSARESAAKKFGAPKTT